MDVENDAILKDRKNRLRSEERARSEERVLDRISYAAITSRDRCEAGLMLIDGESLSDIDRFIAKKSRRRGNDRDSLTHDGDTP